MAATQAQISPILDDNMAQKRKPIQLNRCFHEMKDGDADQSGSVEHGSLAGLGLVKGETWDQILGHGCVVVLGEAGTGKTTEFRQRCALLAVDCRAAFFVTVEDLAARGLDESFGSTDATRFSTWKSSGDRAYFFLDAVDEARLNNQRFTTALRRLERALGSDLARASVLISCRVSDWRAHSDRATVEATLYPAIVRDGDNQPPARASASSQDVEMESLRGGPPIPPRETSHVDSEADAPNGVGVALASSAKTTAVVAQQAVKVYTLAPLDHAQVELLAADLGVSDGAVFADAVKRAAAHAYLDRPRDVEWLAGYWLQHHAIGSLTDLIVNDVREKLTEKDPDRRPSLSSAKANSAAEALAGLAALERRSTFLLPDGELDAQRVASSVDPCRWLPDLTRQELCELLTLPLFDEATYGRVRIHHRSVAEYLAARWLQTLLDNGLSSREVEDLLLRRGSDGPVVPRELVAIAAWLAGTNTQIRARLLEVAPTVLLEGGDPNKLPRRLQTRAAG